MPDLRTLTPLVAAAVLLASPSAIRSQAPSLVRDINTTSAPDPSSDPEEFVEFAGAVYFRGTRPGVGTELFKTTRQPGTVQLVKDLNPGLGSSDPRELTVAGNQLFFLAGRSPTQLWRSDGTTAGTTVVGGSFYLPQDLCAVGSTVFFSANHVQYGRELWRSDGTSAGTTLVKDLLPGTNGSNPDELTEWNGVLLFSARFGVGITSGGLHRSDGTAAGTVLVKAFTVQFNGPRFLTELGGAVYFEATGVSPAVKGVWKSDGTAAGTVSLRAGMAFEEPVASPGLGMVMFTSVGRLWRTDGTAAGTLQLTTEISSSPAVAGSLVLFLARPSGGSSELWRTDGTPGGTGPVGAGSPSSGPLVTLGQEVFFAMGGPLGSELWRSDGTPAGTKLVADINPGPESSSPAEITPIGSELYLAAVGAGIGREPFRSDLTQAGTVLLENMVGWTSTPNTFASNPRELTDYAGTLLFNADGGPSGRELWRSDGTAEGTSMVIDIQVGGSSDPRGLAVVGGEVLFTANSGPTSAELWATDGTAAGTRIVKSSLGRDEKRGYAVAGDTLYFVGNDAPHGKELWKSDGTTVGTSLVADLTAGPGDTDLWIWSTVGATVYFAVGTAPSTYELWRSDGTAAGTFSLAPVPDRSPSGQARLGDKLLFAGVDAAHGVELWQSDGTPGGTSLLADLSPGVADSSPDAFAVLGETLFFTAHTRPDSAELWKTDGTVAGTVLVVDLGACLCVFNELRSITAWGEALLLRRETPYGDELWISGGTAASTVPLGTVVFFTEVEPAGGRAAYLSITLYEGETELAVTRGTNGIFSASGRYVGLASWTPERLTWSGSHLFFDADDGTSGKELWAVELGATAQPVGASCAAAAQMLRLSSDDPVLGATASIDGGGALPGTSGALLIGLPEAGLPLGSGCFLTLQPSSIAVLAPVQATGSSWSTSVPLPLISALVGVRVSLQAVLGPTSTPLGADVTNGVLWTLGF